MPIPYQFTSKIYSYTPFRIFSLRSTQALICCLVQFQSPCFARPIDAPIHQDTCTLDFRLVHSLVRFTHSLIFSTILTKRLASSYLTMSILVTTHLLLNLFNFIACILFRSGTLYPRDRLPASPPRHNIFIQLCLHIIHILFLAPKISISSTTLTYISSCGLTS